MLLLGVVTGSASAASVQLTVQPSTGVAGAHPTLRTAVSLPTLMTISPFSRASLQSIEVNYGPGLTVDASRMGVPCDSPSGVGGCPAASRFASASATALVGGRLILFGGYIAKSSAVDANGLNQTWLVLEADYPGSPAARLRVVQSAAITWPNNYCGPTGEGCRTKPPYRPGRPVFGNRVFQLPQSFVVNGITRQARFFSLTSQTTSAAATRGVVTNPTSCAASSSTAVATLADGSVLTGQSSVSPTQCTRLGFRPTADVRMSKSSDGKGDNLNWHFGGDTTIKTLQQANIRSASLHLQAADLDADGLADRTVCELPDAELSKCPASSEIGEASISLPFLSKAIKEAKIIRSRNSNDTSAGGGAKSEKGKIVVIKDGEGGIVRYVLDLSITHATDGIDITIPELADMPVSAFSMQLRGVVRGSEQCDDYDANSNFTAWSGAAATVSQPDAISVNGCVVTITAGPREGFVTQNSETDFEFVSRSNRGHECLLDDAAKFAPCTSPLHLSGLNDGPHSLSIRAVGCAGCTEPVTTRTWIVDRIDPEMSFRDFRDGDSDGDGFANERFRPAFFDVFAEASDITSGIDWASGSCVARNRAGGGVRSGSFQLHTQSATRFSCSFTDLPEGNTDVEISVADNAGNVTVLKRSYTVDSTAPGIAIDEPGVQITGDPDFDLLALTTDESYGLPNAEPTGTCEITGRKGWDGTIKGNMRFTPGPTPDSRQAVCTARDVASGRATGKMVVTDAAGNSSTQFFDIFVDLAPPSIAIDEPGVQITGDPDFDLLALTTDESYGLPNAEPTGTCEITGRKGWDGTIKGNMRFTPGPTPDSRQAVCTARDVASGRATGKMVVTDAAGNSSTQFFDIFVDLAPPVISTTDPKDDDCDGRADTPDACFRPAFFDIFVELNDADSGIRPQTFTAVATFSDGVERQLAVGDLDGDGSPDVVHIEGAPDGIVEIRMSVADNAGHVTVLKQTVVVDTKPPLLLNLAPSNGDWAACRYNNDPYAEDAARQVGSVVVRFDLADSTGDVASAQVSFNRGPRQTVSLDGSRTSQSFAMEVDCREMTTGVDVEYRVFLADRAGNESVSSAEFRPDVTPPTLTTTDPKDDDCDGRTDTADSCFRPAFFDVFFDVADVGSGADLSTLQCRAKGVIVKTPGNVTGKLVDDDGDGTPDRCAIEGASDGDLLVEISAADATGNVGKIRRKFTIEAQGGDIDFTRTSDEQCDTSGAQTDFSDCVRPASFDVFFDVANKAPYGLHVQCYVAPGRGDGAGDACDDDEGCALSGGDLDGDGVPDYVCHVKAVGEGPRQVTVTLRDRAGNSSARSIQTTVDSTPPTLATVDPRDDDSDGDGVADHPARSTTFELFFDRYEEGKSVGASSTQCSAKPRNGGVVKGAINVVNGNRFSCGFSGLPEGDVDVEITTSDAAGNVAVLTRSFSVDGTPPRIFILLPSRGAWMQCANDPASQQARIPIRFALFDNSADPVSVEVAFNRGPRQSVSLDGTRQEQSAEINVDCREMTTGMDVEYRVFATDAAGNEDQEAVTFRLDTEPTKVEFPHYLDADADNDGVADQPYRPADFNIPFDTSDVGSGVNREQMKATATFADGSQSNLALGDLNSDSYPDVVLVENAMSGPIEISLSVPDNSGHVTVLKRRWVVDTSAPGTKITGPLGLLDADGDGSPDSPYQSASFDVFFDATDDSFGDPAGRRAERRKCRATSKSTPWKHHDIQGLDAPDGAAGNSVCSFEGLEDDDWEILVTTTDGAGNASSQQVDVTVDTVAPELSIHSPAEGQTVECTIRPGSVGTCQVDVEYEVLDQTSGAKLYSESGLTGTNPLHDASKNIREISIDELNIDIRETTTGLDVEYRITATDNAGNVTCVTRHFRVAPTAPPVPPHVQITAPAASSSIVSTSNPAQVTLQWT
ncbi:MAG: hypothetical protein JHC87_02745, partial [Thermoleophilaceae bacterium]|nr:hypothetical protein [Thermoleophilaceae bacterium]